MLGADPRRALAAVVLTATGFAVRAFSLAPPPGLEGLFGAGDLDLAAGDPIALVHAAAAIVALFPHRASGMLAMAWSALGGGLWVLVVLSSITMPSPTLIAASTSVAMVLAYAGVVWLLFPLIGPVVDPRPAHVRGPRFHGVAITIPLLLIGVIATPAIVPPNGLTREQYAFCTAAHDRLFGGQEHVWEIASLYLGPLPQDGSVLGPYRDPAGAAACKYAHLLVGLSADESVWCADAEGRAIVGDAVETLGTDDRGASYPGDSAAEYAQACRLAYRFLRGPSPETITPEHEAFVLTPREHAFCDTVGADDVDAMLRLVELQPPSPATPVETAASRALGCRLVYIADTFDRARA